MKILRRFSVASIVVALAGCMSNLTSGNKLDTNSIRTIRTGKTTKADMVRVFGQPPTRMTRDKGTEIWVYSHTKAKNHTNAATFIPIVGLFAGGGKLTTDSESLTVEFSGEIVSSCMHGTLHSDTEVNGLIQTEATSNIRNNTTTPCEEAGIPLPSQVPSGSKQL